MDPLGSIKEVFIVIVLILMNGLLAMLEMALVSARKSRLEQLADEGSSKAAYILKLAQEPTEFLSTVQIGITLVGIGTGVYSGAMLAAPLEGLLREISVLRPYAGVVSYTFVVALVTYLSLILGELIPKKMALNNPEKVAMSFAGFIKVIITAFKPLTVFLSVSTRFLLKALGLKPSDEPPVTEEEVRVLLEQGRLHGVFNVGEQKMIENVFELDDLRVSEIMTPRTKITWLDVNDPLYKHLEVIAEKQYSCYVVAEEDLEHVLGVVYTKRFLADVLGATGASMRSSVQQPLYVPEGMYTQKLLDMFKDTRIKVALVMDEFGGLAGMVTLRDIIEHLVGDLPSYDEEFKQEIVEREDGSWLVDGLLPISEFKDVSTRFLLKALGLKPSDEPPVTEEEVRVLLEQGRLHGVFNVGEQKMIENVFELDDLRVSEIMTPRTKITWLDVNDPLYKHLEVIAEKQYSCYVVAEEDLEHVLGVVYTKRFLADVLGATGASMRSSVQQPLYVPEGMYTQKLLDMFKDTRIKVALVMDEFGGLAGMVTLRDIIEHLVGDLPSYDEEFKQEIVEREDGSWLVDGLLPISEFKDFLDLDELPLEEKTGFNTVAGFVVTNIGHIPTAGNYFLWNGYRFEVVDMDGTRIDKILVEKLPEAEAAETDTKDQ